MEKDVMEKEMNGKIIIRSRLVVLTGLHIGGSSAYSAIGTVDAPVIKSEDGRPIVPGSSLKGKMRTLLASVEDTKEQFADIKKDIPAIQRLFGSSADDRMIPARLQFADAYVIDKTRSVASLTEVKFENVINRGTCQAMPRQIERVVPRTAFETTIVYNVKERSEMMEDMTLLAKAMRLLQFDYLGGHGSRGSGRVCFEDIHLQPAFFALTEQETKDLATLFKGVEDHESKLLHL